MSGPVRVQLSRRRGWRKPAGAVVVSRPSRWGNPFDLGRYPDAADDRERRRLAVRDFTAMLEGRVALPDDARDPYPTRAEIREALRGKDLACWCPLDGACHADVLIAVANDVRS